MYLKVFLQTLKIRFRNLKLISGYTYILKGIFKLYGFFFHKKYFERHFYFFKYPSSINMEIKQYMNIVYIK
jgi:hypothetical protein